MKSITDGSTGRDDVPLPPDIGLNVFKTGNIRGGTNITLEIQSKNCGTIQRILKLKTNYSICLQLPASNRQKQNDSVLCRLNAMMNLTGLHKRCVCFFQTRLHLNRVPMSSHPFSTFT